MGKYRKRPVVVEAVQVIPGGPIADGVKLWPDENGLQPRDGSFGYIQTLEGRMHVSAFDWIITGVNGEKYPCKPHIFEKTYEMVFTDSDGSLFTPEVTPAGKTTKGDQFASYQQHFDLIDWDK